MQFRSFIGFEIHGRIFTSAAPLIHFLFREQFQFRMLGADFRDPVLRLLQLPLQAHDFGLPFRKLVKLLDGFKQTLLMILNHAFGLRL